MASIELDSASRRYRIRFRFNGQSNKRSLKTTTAKEARSILGRVEETIALIERGRLEMPEDVDPAAFFLSEGKRNGKPARVQLRTIRELFEHLAAARSE